MTRPIRRKPIILCLHGGGTSSTIFNVQSIRIQRPLAKFFDFVFADGPFTSMAGPGVLPTFEGCEPYFSWIQSGKSLLSAESMQAIENALKGRESDVVGVLGFSQGGRVGAGLLLMQQLRGQKSPNGVDFKFGVMCMSVTPPMVSKEYWDRSDDRIRIPSIHVVGTEDQWYEEGLRLFHEHFDKAQSAIMEFPIGHRLPIVDEQNTQIVDAIKKLYTETTGQELVEFVE